MDINFNRSILNGISAAYCCAAIGVNAERAAANAFSALMRADIDRVSLRRPRERPVGRARKSLIVAVDEERAGCSCFAVGERAADAEDAGQTPVR